MLLLVDQESQWLTNNMSRLKKRNQSLESLKRLCGIGTQQEKSTLSEPLLTTVDTTLSQSLVKVSAQQSSTQELAVTNSALTLTDKLTTSKAYTPKQKSLKKSAQGSTIKEKSFVPFWNGFCQEVSNELWSDTKIDLQGLDLSLSSGSVNSTLANSWFVATNNSLQSEKWWKTYSPLFTSLAVDSTASESTKVKSKKTRIYPESELKITWRKWLAASRYCYNQSIAQMRDTLLSGEKCPSAYGLRKQVMAALPGWVGECPYNLRGAAVIDAHAAFWKTKDKARPRFRSCRDSILSFKLQSQNWKKGITYPTAKSPNGVRLKTLSVNPSETLPEAMPSDFSVVFDRGRWFITYTVLDYDVQPATPVQAIALDPGVRTFLTGFDGESIVEIGKGSISRIVKLCKRLDDIQSKTSLAKGTKNKRVRFNLRKLARQLRIKITNLVDECHKKAACFLTSNYSHIIIPTFETSDMVYRAKRKIGSKTARSMLTWAHYRFKQRLTHQAAKRGSTVIEMTEEYTSKTCSKCGHVHRKLGGSKTFKCPECGHKIDRDANGSINIYIKQLSEFWLRGKAR